MRQTLAASEFITALIRLADAADMPAALAAVTTQPPLSTEAPARIAWMA
jgi:hypothetical protein